MEFTEEEIAHSLMNVSEDRRVRALETFRRLKRDMDAFEDDLASMGVTRRAFARSSVAQALDPELWSALPLELVHLVFARLPLVDMIRLRALSTTWNRYVSGDMPGFTKVCAEVNPKLFGLIGDGSEVYEDGQMAVMLPGSGTSWLKYGCTPPMEGYVDTMRAGDGGLVCIVSLSKSARQDPRIVVHNPLTCRNRALPRLPWHMQSARFSMVQLVMDRDPKCYKVLVLCYRGQSLHASVFCSITGRWRGPEAPDGLVFGYRHDWNRGFLNDPDTAYPSSRNPCFYDCASGELADLDDESSPWKAPGVLPAGRLDRKYVLVKDRLFVLHKGLFTGLPGLDYSRYWISEYQAQRRPPFWAKLRDHSCSPFDVGPTREYIMLLYACRGFLLVTANNGNADAFEHDLAWVYEIASEKWRDISGGGDELTLNGDLVMFELQWDALP